MRLRAGDVLGIEALVEIDRGVDAAHDRGRAAGKAAAPHRVGLAGGAVALVSWRGSASFGTAVTIVLLLALIGAGLGGRRRPIQASTSGSLSRPPPQPAPEVAFTDAEGKPASLADFRGKPIVVNLWATWCQPCLREMPSLERLQAKLAGSSTVAAVSQDRGGEQGGRPVRRRARARQGQRSISTRRARSAGAFEVRGLPTSIVLDARRPGGRPGRRRGRMGFRQDDGRTRAARNGCRRSDEELRLERAPLSTSRRKQAAALAAPPDRSSARCPGRRASRPARRPAQRRLRARHRVERHERVLGAVDQQHRRARAQFARPAVRARSAGRNSRECRRAARRGAGRRTATSSCPARSRPAPRRCRSGRASATPRR